ncbi:PREDICTED: uncharacterized protein LOC107352559 [Acropora digitifera]|uniref:uncharacterized protein LOC107352559 n=1 Tax=Acropora digitifera TaxID=70779 RepID=UPI00077A6E5D|nr:PREDICTED: uncharacterized protein LOC107352559 [Acropora digitifera]
MSFLSSLFVSSLLLYVVLEASIRDSVTVREESKKLSIPQMKKTLKKAHLENHGYRKKVTQETLKDSRGRLSSSKITSFTHKPVPCSKALQVVNETKSMLLKYTENSMTGKKLSEMAECLRKEIGSQKAYRRRLCKIKLDLKTTRLWPPSSGNYRPKRSSWFGGGGSSGGSRSRSGGRSRSRGRGRSRSRSGRVQGSFSFSCELKGSVKWESG